ncbi:hypothetical protein HU200_066383 [Digitaria exilis]|uniref:Uncharacterized protein n=1 Tax=Digitaria exilis TaxID=1010633 RepID=A0A835A7R7_9POAL|nr:hypothetical protein HU200_066383 [Digitaria exilis]
MRCSLRSAAVLPALRRARVRQSSKGARPRASASPRCQAVAADERSVDPAFPRAKPRASRYKPCPSAPLTQTDHSNFRPQPPRRCRAGFWLIRAVERPEADVVVIGSGLGGLCCAGLLARYGQDVLVLESHDRPGGRGALLRYQGVQLRLGPSLFSGFQFQRAPGKSTCSDLETFVGVEAVQEWKRLLVSFLVYYSYVCSCNGLAPLSIRGDLGVLSTAAGRYAPSLLKSFIQMGPQGALGATKLLRPFKEIVDSLGLKNPFVRNWIDLLCFLLAGVKSDGALSAEMVYMFAEWYKPGCLLEYPLGGTGAIIDALVSGIKKFGGRIALRSHVEKILIENGRAVGVKLRSGQIVRAKKAVVSNASMWDTLDLLPPDVVPKSYEDKVKATPQCDSFMHLHLGFDVENAREDLGIHHIVVDDWNKGVDGEQNVVFDISS